MYSPEEIERVRFILDDIAKVYVESQDALDAKRRLEEENAYLQRKLDLIKNLTDATQDQRAETVITPEPAAEAVAEPEAVSTVDKGTIKFTYLDQNGIRTHRYFGVDNVEDLDADLAQAVLEIRDSDRHPQGHSVAYRVYDADDIQVGRTAEYDWEFTS